jgi:hypothetical protein
MMVVRVGATLYAAMALVACDRSAQSNPNAPGQPGTGNATEVARPQAGDGPPGGSSGPAGKGPIAGSSGGSAVPGTTGSGGGEVSQAQRGQTAQPGTGTAGGLGGSAGLGMTGSFPGASATTTPGVPNQGAAPQGSPNAVSGGATGGR